MYDDIREGGMIEYLLLRLRGCIDCSAHELERSSEDALIIRLKYDVYDTLGEGN